MVILFVIGLALLGGAFFAAAAETMAHGVAGVDGVFLSAREVMYALWPAKLVILQIKAEALNPYLWNPVLTTILALPGWLVLGVPGGFLFWWGHPKRRRPPDDEDDFDEESLYLFDRLAERAEAEGYGDGDDLDPSVFFPGEDGGDGDRIDDDEDDAERAVGSGDQENRRE